MNSKLYVTNLSWSATEQDLRTLFSQVGDVVSVRIPTNRDTGRPRGFAFVEMQTSEEAERVIQNFYGSMFLDRDLVITYQDENRGNGGGGAPSRGGYGNSSGGGSPQPSNQLFVRNVSYNVSEAELGQLFNQAGAVLSVKIPFDRNTQQPKGFAFVEMESSDAAKAVIDQFNGMMVDNRPLIVDFQDPNRARTRTPSGGGGGGGGGRYNNSRW